MHGLEKAMKPEEYDIRHKYIMFNCRYFGGLLPEDLPLGFANLRSATHASGKGAYGMFYWNYHPELSLIHI